MESTTPDNKPNTSRNTSSSDTNGVGTGRTPIGTSSQDVYRDVANQNVHDARQQLKDGIHAAGEDFRAKAGPRMESAKTSARELCEQAESSIRQRPWMALGLAALVGMVAAKLLR